MKYSNYGGPKLKGTRSVLERGSQTYPHALDVLANPPERLYVLGEVSALREGLAVVGARKATPYGLGCTRRFTEQAAKRGIVIISGGARGCDAEAHRTALAAGTPTIAFLGGGCDQVYPAEHYNLFQSIIDGGGAVVSEHPWEYPPLPYAFRARNRLIAGLSRATLIVEAGLPSGTFSTADEALAANRDVLVVPGAITSAASRGANRLIYQGAVPIIDDETFEDVLFSIFGQLKQQVLSSGELRSSQSGNCEAKENNVIVSALQAAPLGSEELYDLALHQHHGTDVSAWLMECLVEAETAGLIARYPDGRWGPVVSHK